MKNNEWGFQGDVVLIRVPAVRGEKQETRVVQEGEHTGHAHRLNEHADIYQDGDRRYVRARDGARLTHEEHDTTVITEGDYEVRIVRQKDPFTKLISRVVD